MKRTTQIDIFNLGLLFVSFLLAYLLPFRVFLYGFAILGPLHYLTEINWLNSKSYFIPNKRNFRFPTLVLAFLYSLPFIFKIPFFNQIIVALTLTDILQEYHSWTNGIFLGVVGFSIGLVFFKKDIIGLLLGLLFGGSILFFHNNVTYNTWVGIFFPTIIHVYLFTLLFMLYGTLKTKSKVGYLNVFLLILAPFIIVLLDINPENYHFPKEIKATYIDNSFHYLNVKLSQLIGGSDGTGFYFYNAIDLKIQLFIAFAYIYHYLNWFSKTAIIGWHKTIDKKKGVVIIALWLTSVALFFYDFTTGGLVTFFLSILHGRDELPLNTVSIKGILHSYFSVDEKS